METKRVLDIEKLELKSGEHSGSFDGFCLMEAVAYVGGEPWTDHPQCACPVLGTFLRSWNDTLGHATRQKLKPYIPRLVGTNDGNNDRRGWMFLDWLSRECAPALLDAAGLDQEAASLRELPEILDARSLALWCEVEKVRTFFGSRSGKYCIPAPREHGVQPKFAEASKAGDAEMAAVMAAVMGVAWDIAWDVTRSAVRDAVRAAVMYAAGGAARAIAGDVEGAAAWNAARAATAVDDVKDVAKFAPVVARLQESVFSLIDRMLSLPGITGQVD